MPPRNRGDGSSGKPRGFSPRGTLPERDASPPERGTPRLHDQGPNLITALRNGNHGNGLGRDRSEPIHVLPTNDPRLDFIGEMWDHLTDQIRDKLVEMIQEHAAACTHPAPLFRSSVVA